MIEFHGRQFEFFSAFYLRRNSNVKILFGPINDGQSLEIHHRQRRWSLSSSVAGKESQVSKQKDPILPVNFAKQAVDE